MNDYGFEVNAVSTVAVNRVLRCEVCVSGLTKTHQYVGGNLQ